MCRRWREIPKPMIAMIQGACIAGGLMLAFVCDLIVATDDAFFADPVVRMGIPGVEYFAHPWVLGSRAAKEILFTGDRFTAQRAYEWGMVNRVVAARRPRDRDARDRRPDRGDAAVRARAHQAGGEPVRGRDGHAHRHGLGVRAAPLRARPQRRGRAPTRSAAWTPEVDEAAAPVDLDLDDGHASRSATRCATWLRDHVPQPPLPSMDTPDGFAAHRDWEHTLADARLSVVSWPHAFGGRDATLDAVGGLRGGVLRGRRAATREPERDLPAGADAVRARHARAARADPAADGPGRRDLGAGVVRAGGRQRPRRLRSAGPSAPTAAGCCPGRRPGRRARPTPTAGSGCSAPTPTPSGTAA